MPQPELLPTWMEIIMEIEASEKQNILKTDLSTIVREKIVETGITIQDYGSLVKWRALRDYIKDCMRQVLSLGSSTHSSTGTTSMSSMTARIPIPFAGVSSINLLNGDLFGDDYETSQEKISTPLSYISSQKGTSTVMDKCEFTTAPDIAIELFITNLKTVTDGELWGKQMWKFRNPKMALYLDSKKEEQNLVALKFLELLKQMKHQMKATRERQEQEVKVQYREDYEREKRKYSAREECEETAIMPPQKKLKKRS